MIPFIQSNLLWTEGIQIVTVLGALALVAALACRPLLWVILLAFLFSFYFFRNPHRVCLPALNDPTVIVCPADGKIVDIRLVQNPDDSDYAYVISIFLSPLDVHVTWSPVAGNITSVTYRPGTFSLAFLPKSSELNERNDMCIAHNGTHIRVRQIAGTIARRICCWVKPGDTVTAGHKIGMIRFGSRVDLFLPAHVRLSVGNGQRVYGGQTVIGRWI